MNKTLLVAATLAASLLGTHAEAQQDQPVQVGAERSGADTGFDASYVE